MIDRSGDSLEKNFGWIFVGLGALLTLFGLVAGAVVGFVKPPRDMSNRRVPQPAPAAGFGAPPFPMNGAPQQYGSQYGPNQNLAGFGNAPSGTNHGENFGPAPGYGAPGPYSQQPPSMQPSPYSSMPQPQAPSRDAYGQAPYSQAGPSNYPPSPAPNEPHSGPPSGPTAPLPRSAPLPHPKKTSD